MTKRVTSAVVVRDGHTACHACGHALGKAGTPWKGGARMRERPMRGAGGVAFVGGDRVVLRQFVCPGCATLLDTETALPEDPYLDDVVAP